MSDAQHHPALHAYRAKRDFTRTPEPAPSTPAHEGQGWAYAVQKHAATSLHYDLRLELDGVLLSWALPKGPSLDPAVKPLAMRTEDHPLAYVEFEGVIPEGNYGAGTVMLWDRGTWEPIGNPGAALAKGDLKLRLHGSKLRGEWAIVRMRTKDAPDNAWVLIKKRDEHARSISDYNILAQQARSVATGRTMAQIARDRDAEWRSTPKGAPRSDAAPSGGRASAAHQAPRSTPEPSPRAHHAPGLSPAEVPLARPAVPPTALPPQLASIAPAPPEGEDWLHEPKLDGYRLLAHVNQGSVVLRTRNGHDWTARFPAIARELGRLALPGTILDGEVVALDTRSVPDFAALQRALTSSADSLVYYVFDIPFAAAHDLRKTPLIDRKTYLRAALAAAGLGERVRYLDHIIGRGPIVFDQAVAAGFEGSVAKRARAPYESRRTPTWLKCKAGVSEEFLIVGWTPGEGSRAGFGALLLARQDRAGAMVFQGSVGSGFSDQDLSSIRRELDARAVRRRPLAAPLPTPADERAARWVQPSLVAEVAFAGRTGDGMLRHPVFRRVRADTDLADVPLADAPDAPPALRVKPPPSAPVSAAAVVAAPRPPSDALVAGVRISNPDRFVYPEAAITKRDVAEYLAHAAPLILPHVAHRPLSLVRCPLGLAGEHFYQRHLAEGFPPSVKGLVIDDDPDGPSIVVHDALGLVALAQMGVLEIHPWNAQTDRPDRPDRLILDLDPGEALGWAEIVAAAHFVRDYVERLGLRTFVKTSGGRGVHILIPVARRHTWDQAKTFTRAIAKELARLAPRNFVAQMTKAMRTHRVYVDFLRNQKGATAVGPYSPRAHESAAVSMPLAWDQLDPATPPETFTVRSAAAHLRARGADPWADFDTVRQSITNAMRDAVGA